MFNIFEHPWALLITAAIVAAAVWICIAVIPKKKLRWLWLLPLFIATTAPAIDGMVQTDIEKIALVIKKASKAVEKENSAAVDTLIAENYQDSIHKGKINLMRHCKAQLSQPLVQKNITRISSIDLTGPKATVTFNVRTVFDPQSFVYQSYKGQMLFKVEAELQKTGTEWLISRIEILTIDLQPAGWKDIRKFAY
jgi:hypothetical protein